MLVYIISFAAALVAFMLMKLVARTQKFQKFHKVHQRKSKIKIQNLPFNFGFGQLWEFMDSANVVEFYKQASRIGYKLGGILCSHVLLAPWILVCV